MPEHVLIAQRVLGHPLPSGAQVHHVNGNGRDNRHQNLVICENASYHKILHVRQRLIAAGGDPSTDRLCATCKQPKPVTQFKVISVGFGREAKRSSYCRPCQLAYDRQRGRKASASKPRIPRGLYHSTKTHCKWGHEFTPDNTARDKKKPHIRICRACQRRQALARYHRNQDALNARQRERRRAAKESNA